MTNLNTPIRYGENDGLDDAREGSREDGRMTRMGDSLPLYAVGSKVRGMTAPSLYPNGLGDPRDVAVFRPVAGSLYIADDELLGTRTELVVHSGFLSPANQAERWKVLDATRSKKSPWEEILAGRFADSAGSVAQPIDDDAFKTAYAEMKEDKALVEELSAHGDVDSLIKELIMYRANNGKLSSVKVDILSAKSIHNLGHSVNVGLREPDGEILNMGVGIDIPSPVQRVDFFEKNGPAEYEAAIAAEPLLREFLSSMGVESVNEDLIEEIRDNRRELFNAMTQAGFGSYRGEQGHFTMAPESGEMPSRDYAYRQARKYGYKIN